MKLFISFLIAVVIIFAGGLLLYINKRIGDKYGADTLYCCYLVFGLLIALTWFIYDL